MGGKTRELVSLGAEFGRGVDGDLGVIVKVVEVQECFFLSSYANEVMG